MDDLLRPLERFWINGKDEMAELSIQEQLKKVTEERDLLKEELDETKKRLAEAERTITALTMDLDQAETRYVDMLDVAQERQSEINRLKEKLGESESTDQDAERLEGLREIERGLEASMDRLDFDD